MLFILLIFLFLLTIFLFLHLKLSCDVYLLPLLTILYFIFVWLHLLVFIVKSQPIIWLFLLTLPQVLLFLDLFHSTLLLLLQPSLFYQYMLIFLLLLAPLISFLLRVFLNLIILEKHHSHFELDLHDNYSFILFLCPFILLLILLFYLNKPIFSHRRAP